MGRMIFAGQAIWVWIRGGIAAFCLALAAPALAQDGTPSTWIQLQALPSLALAEQSARAFSPVLSPIAGFAARGRNWYVVALGPLPRAEAARRLADLKSQGVIPRDAFLSDGKDYGRQFWPVGAALGAEAALPSTQAADDRPPAVPVDPTTAPEISDESESAALAGEAALSRDEKVQLQAGLGWFGHYQGALDGSIGRGTRAAMAAWQTAQGYAPTGVLTRAQRAQLLADFQAQQASFGFETYADAEAGVEFSLPAAMLGFDRYEPPFVHFSARGASNIRLLIISEPGDASTLAGLYEQLQTLDAVPNLGARALADDRFTIEGRSDSAAAYASARASKGTIKGYMLLWAPTDESKAQRILAALQGSFRSTGDQVLDPGLVPLDDALRSGVLAGMAVKEPIRSLSGFFADAGGLVVTLGADLRGCGQITLDGQIAAQLVASDDASGAAILRPMAPVAPLAFAQAARASSAPGSAVLIAGYSLPRGLPAPVLTTGEITSVGGPAGEAGLLTLRANLTAHDRGGPVLDATGAVIGMVLGAMAGGKTVPPGTALALHIGAIAPLLLQAGAMLPADAAGSANLPSLAAREAQAMGMTVQVSCWP